MVSGSISLPSPGFFSPFPHGTAALSVATEYLALDRGRPGFRQDFSCPAVLRNCITESSSFRLRGFHPLWPAFPKPFCYVEDLSLCGLPPCSPTTPRKVVWAFPISLAATIGISGGSLLFLISFPGLLRWFSSPSVASASYFIQTSDDGISSIGLPHSAIQGLQDMCSFPWLIAAYHGLLRLVAPRHSPYTYIRLTILSFSLPTFVYKFAAVQAFQNTDTTSGVPMFSKIRSLIIPRNTIFQFPRFLCSLHVRKVIFRLRIPSLLFQRSLSLFTLKRFEPLVELLTQLYIAFRQLCASGPLWRIGDSNP